MLTTELCTNYNGRTHIFKMVVSYAFCFLSGYAIQTLLMSVLYCFPHIPIQCLDPGDEFSSIASVQATWPSSML